MKDSINARNCYQPHYFTAVIPIAATSITVTKGENKAKKLFSTVGKFPALGCFQASSFSSTQAIVTLSEKINLQQIQIILFSSHLDLK